ncbi:MAG: SDR family oxidoreductase [Chloroflexales bacterium]|nr:SDR family oxidoreductase [Chloroflexales bacterium]
MAGQFDGKVALVTGGGSGIGRSSSLAFAREGAIVVVADVDAQHGRETAQMIKDAGGEAMFFRADVSRATEVAALIDALMSTYQRLDFAHNNAGIEGMRGNTVECTEENWDQVTGVNLKAIWLCMKYEIPQMLKSGKGAIVNGSSATGLVGSQGVPAYVASKHGVIGLTRAAALEFARQGIRVNAVCPGAIETPMLQRITGGDQQVLNQVREAEPIGRMGQPEEVAAAVIWLCSDASSFVTGHALAVDGARLAE